MKLKPLNNNVVLKINEIIKESKSGIILPESAGDKYTEAEVVAVADGVSIVSIGETVLFDTYSGAEQEIDNQKYIIIDSEKILSIIER